MSCDIESGHRIEGIRLSSGTYLTMQETGFVLWVGKVSWRGEGPPTPECSPGHSRGQWSLAGLQRVGHDLVTKQQQAVQRLCALVISFRVSPVAQAVQNPPAMRRRRRTALITGQKKR